MRLLSVIFLSAVTLGCSRDQPVRSDQANWGAVLKQCPSSKESPTSATVKWNQSPSPVSYRSKEAGLLGADYIKQAEQETTDSSRRLALYQLALSSTRHAIFTAQSYQEEAWLIRWQWQLGRIWSRGFQRLDEAIAAYQQAVQWLVPDECDAKQFAKFRWNIRDLPYETLRKMFLELAELLLQRADHGQNSQPHQQDLQKTIDLIEKLKTADLEHYYQDDCLTAFQRDRLARKINDATAVVIYPLILPERLELLVTFLGTPSPSKIYRFTLPVNQTALEKVVKDFGEQISKGRYAPRNEDYLKPAQQLYHWLITPWRPLLLTTHPQIRTVVWIPDGILLAVNPATFYDGQQFLIEQYAVAMTPGLSLTMATTADDSPINPQKILLTALTKATQGYPDLSYGEQEFEQVKSILGDKGNKTVRAWQNEKFTTERFKQELSNPAYRLIHIISHAQFAKNPEDIAIITYDNRLSFREFECLVKNTGERERPTERKIPLELLTLSACSTATGNDTQWAALGLSGVAIKGGAKSSLATLWKAYDLTTSEMVSDFYDHWWETKLPKSSKAVALQEAQLKLVHSRDYRHPFFWGHLVLIGNWQ